MWRVRGLRVSPCLCLLPCPPSRCLLLLLVPVSPRCPLSIHLSVPLALLITCAPLSRLCPSPAPSLLMLSHPSLPRGSVLLHPSQRSSSSPSPRRLLHPSLPRCAHSLVHLCAHRPLHLCSLPSPSIPCSWIQLLHAAISAHTAFIPSWCIHPLLIHPGSHPSLHLLTDFSTCPSVDLVLAHPSQLSSLRSFLCCCSHSSIHPFSSFLHLSVLVHNPSSPSQLPLHPSFPLGASSTCPSQHSFCACPSPPTPLLPSLPRQSTRSCARLSLFLLAFLHPSHLLGYIPALLPVRVRLCSHASIQPFLVVWSTSHPPQHTSSQALPCHPPCPITTSPRAARR